jgi:hypothetical protein
MNLPGENLGITLKINKWALLKETACNKMKSTTYPYHVVLAPPGDTKYLLGTVVELFRFNLQI